jgi:TetR/AcrR family transcriptional regulator
MIDQMEPDKPENLEPGTERKILEAAGKIFMKKGRLGASMQDIADEAGINRTLLHYYFRNKEKLFDTIFSRAIARAFPTMVAAFASDRPFMEKIRIFVDTYTDLLMDNPYLPVFIFQEISLNPDRLAGIMRHEGLDPDMVLKGLSREMESSGLHDMDPRHLIANLLGMVIFPYMGRPLFQKVAFRDDAEAYEKFLEERRKQVPRFVNMALRAQGQGRE